MGMLEEFDFRMTGKIVLSAAILLRMKSDSLVLRDTSQIIQEYMEQFAEDFEEFDPKEEVLRRVGAYPELEPVVIRTPHSKVTINDLLTALRKVLNEEEKKSVVRHEMHIEPLKLELPDVDISTFRILQGSALIGKTLAQIELRRRYGVSAVAIRRDAQLLSNPGADTLLQPNDELFVLANEFVKACRTAEVLSIINDRVDVAVAAGADGVHLGQNDLPVECACKLQLTPLVVGKSTHSLDQLRAACLEYPTYVSLGPVFVTDTKPAAEPVGLDYVKQATEILADTGIGNVAIGGITLDNVEDVLNASAGAIAVCSAITEASDPIEACRALKQKITAFNKN